MFNFLRNRSTLFQSAWTLPFSPAVHVSSSFSTSSLALVFYLTGPDRWVAVWYPTVLLISISLMTDNVCVFSCACWHFVIFCEVYGRIICPFLYWIGCLIVEVCDMCYECCSQSVACLFFFFFNGIFRRIESFFLVKSNSSVFFFMVHASCFSIQETFFYLSTAKVFC